MISKPTLVIGASDNVSRYSNIAIRRLKEHAYEVIALGRRASETHGIPIVVDLPDLPVIHTVTLYVNPMVLNDYEALIRKLNPKRVIFNPGTYKGDFAIELQEKGIEVVVGCTLVMLSDGSY
ncbi:MAG: CoA-binding protein [Bacteroidales bacterium]|nr:CoA-binding protein [Bacteroidales bacterium]